MLNLTIGPGSTHQELGFSLVELMVAIALSLFLLLGVSTIYFDSKGSYRAQDSLARVQENARFALLYMGRKLRMAGNLGCVNSATCLRTSGCLNNTLTLTNNVNVFSYGLMSDTAGLTMPTGSYGIVGYESQLGYITRSTHPYPASHLVAYISSNKGPARASFSNSPYYWKTSSGSAPTADVSAVLDNSVVPFSDVVAVRYADPDVATVTSSTATTTLSVAYPAGFNPFSQGELLVASDCARASVFQATSVAGLTITHAGGGTPGNATTTWVAGLYQSGAEVARLRNYVFYIGVGASGTMALFQKTLQLNGTTASLVAPSSTQELVGNVLNMQVLYGVLNGVGGVAYLSADEVTDWSQVSSVKVGLLLYTQERSLSTQNVTTTDTGCPSSTTSPTFNLLDVCVRPTYLPNRYMYRVVSATFNLRNRTP